MTWQQIEPTRQWDGNLQTWMSQLDGSIPLQDLSIPGTHDTAALLGYTHANVSVTQNLKIEDQLLNGIRFFDLRVKIMFSHRGLAMYHGVDALYDPDGGTFDQFYYKEVIGKLVKFLNDNPSETIIVCVKCEGDTKYDGWTVEDWFRQIANEVAADNNGTWVDWWDCRSNINARLQDVRGKLVLWRRFPREGKDPTLDYTQPFGLDLTPMNSRYDNTTHADWYAPNGGYVWVQDHYTKTTLKQKITAWWDSLSEAFASRCIPNHGNANRQFINFSSVGAGKNPSDYSDVMNVALARLLKAMSGDDATVKDASIRHRSGYGVLPMDYPTVENIRYIVRANFEWTYQISESDAGKLLIENTTKWVGNNEP